MHSFSRGTQHTQPGFQSKDHRTPRDQLGSLHSWDSHQGKSYNFQIGPHVWTSIFQRLDQRLGFNQTVNTVRVQVALVWLQVRELGKSDFSCVRVSVKGLGLCISAVRRHPWGFMSRKPSTLLVGKTWSLARRPLPVTKAEKGSKDDGISLEWGDSSA